MKELALNPSHDIELNASGTGIARILGDGFRPQARRVKQAVLCLLRTNEGEAFTDGSHGVPWFEKILTLSETHLDLAQRILEEKIRALEGVRRIKTMELRTDGRNLSGSIAVECEDGSVAEADF